MRKFALPLLTVAALTLLVALPVLFVIFQAVFPHLDAGVLTGAFSAVPALVDDPRLPALLKGTLTTGLGVAAVSAMIGVPLGALRGLFRLPLARCWDALLLAPFLIPPYIAGLSWIMTLQRRGYLEQLTGWRLDHLLFSQAGIILVMSLNIFPVVYFAVSRSMAAAGGRLAEVAQVHGAGPWRAFLLITLPLALPAIAAGVLLAFTLAIEEYGIPAALGTQTGVAVLTVGIEQRLADWPIDLTSAALLSLILAAIALTAYVAQRMAAGGRDVAVTGGKPAGIAARSLGRWRWWVVGLFSMMVLLSVAAPIGAMLTTAFTNTVSGGLHWQNLGTRHFTVLFSQRGEALDALGVSVGLALATALLTGTLGFLAAWLTTGGKVPGAIIIDMLSLLPAALPGVVVAVGLILAWNRPGWPITPYNSGWILLFAYGCLLMPYPVRYVSAALRQLGANLAPAARVHGATEGRALGYIVLPLVYPALLAAMMMVFAIASRELVASLLLAPAGVETVSVFVWRQFEQGSVGDGMAMASVAVLISLVIMLAAVALLHRRQR
ncbi:ABC transporter permease [Martelella alba]|uniref:Iron ABC transporter permease n=1 Tax=Martelella alba TaxID=2590451 RepID=A0ABY2SIS5_9HYPH|nr:iron ABC transporter permease [Martelella alba]TKI05333.1 iron ABC transporter permease [Martelella alba]